MKKLWLNDLRDIGMGEFNTMGFSGCTRVVVNQVWALNTATRVALIGGFQNDFTDWFMPSIDELLMIYQALQKTFKFLQS